jgi:hypothetical protein
MKFARLAALSLLFFSAAALAAPAKDSTIEELMKVVKTRKLMDSMRAQMDVLMDNSVKAALHGKTPNTKQQAAIDKMKKRMVGMLDDELSWKRFEPLSIKLYKETFTEEELQGMLKFYKTPAGQAVINKMPTLMQKTMMAVQGMTQDMEPRLQQIEEDFQKEMAAAGGK